MYDFESFQSCDTDDQKLENESVNQAIVENPVTFHCGRCNTVWADCRGICGEATSVNSLICLEVTQDVTINSEREWSLDGLFSACVYNTLQCAGCLCLMGVILYSTPQHLSALRNLFLLKKDEMYCYIFSTGQMVKASTLNFSVAPLGERVSELKQLIQETESHLSNVSAVMDDTRTNEATSSVQ
ncbi:protein Mis18-beta isoform X2 [Salmo salar]|uniref:Protein Mis18-beta isoform X2 n=1 Tax=Salmo salar TaxID=8030 RepID=A0A1S3SR48_SALSA|nr:protein Mis18-beta isoform X2 [Salmo salar]|eukprot:XP_014066819.1 PREDICTED: protein Mis18-beta isoform X1 [Salmo salar]